LSRASSSPFFILKKHSRSSAGDKGAGKDTLGEAFKNKNGNFEKTVKNKDKNIKTPQYNSMLKKIKIVKNYKKGAAYEMFLY
jgi:predicted ATPase